MEKYRQILAKYWGYQSFRELQEEIIFAVAEEKKDTLALMPTGGGKSITFQVPALAMEGICLVITPLIALMKDQVENLRKRNIKSLMIHSGMTAREIDITLNNAVFGSYKFLYLSPERLQTDIFRVRLERMNVSLIAVDESHCISQWGYDFRPSYLQIAEIRKNMPNVPVLALTATATPRVVDDIMEKLNFRKPNLLKKSFERKNLVYIVRTIDDKTGYLLNILKKERGSGIVYVRSRKATRETAQKLVEAGIPADFYHAGLSPEIRSVKQDDWQSGRTRIIVATNAFGMGIDKPDVRVVVHIDLPDSVEAYFQEAGRAGRDGNRAYAVLLYNSGDRAKFEQRYRNEFPDIDKIKTIYQSACNYMQLAYGAGKNTSRSFNMEDFSQTCKFYPATVISAFKFLRKENIAELTEEINNPSRLHFTVNRDDLYKIQINNPDIDNFIKTVLRAYAGLFNDFVYIDEAYLAKIMFKSGDEIYNMLVRLGKMKIAEYIPQKRSPMLIFHEERLDSSNIRISTENYLWAKNRFTERMNAMLLYAESESECRSVRLLAYFGEKNARPCAQCDVCRRRTELNMSKYEFDAIVGKIKSILEQSPSTLENIIQQTGETDKTIMIVRRLLDSGKMRTQNGVMEWTSLPDSDSTET
ncbi:MAG: RecQ family ATP-dependent DNA helicase [Prevotellaceae bacterium]|jgi:ATP-dependent DNA helicase RecQ|nr:RecQ family ATP-dependent DNA helicase [Prevotellaceae bacterium]